MTHTTPSTVCPIVAEQLARAEYEATTKHGGYSLGLLRYAFEQIQDNANWKNPIVRAEIEAVNFGLFNTAAEYYTGAGLRVVGQFTRPDGVVMVVVDGPGYYATCGA